MSIEKPVEQKKKSYLDGIDFTIPTLGENKYDSPFFKTSGSDSIDFVSDGDYTLYKVDTNDFTDRKLQEEAIHDPRNRMERAGARKKLYFNPDNVRAGISTSGGLCPGLNDVIRSLVRSLMLGYGVKTVWGFRYGYRGFLLDSPMGPMRLDPDIVDDIHLEGGTILGSARGGGEKTEEIVDTLQRYRINMLFVIGGDGSQKGAAAIADEAERRGYDLAVVGVPKTIDNDLSFINKSFGFETAVGIAQESVYAAHVEANGVMNGVGLVKVMGRDSGFIAAQTALASQQANYVLIPEVPFDLDGPKGLLKSLTERLGRKGHAVIVVAEGAGADLMEAEWGKIGEKDAGGNARMHDIGLFLKEKISAHFKSIGLDAMVRYIDPSYTIRASAPNSNDAIYCARLGNNAVHAAMAGKTKVLMSQWNGIYVHVPIKLATRSRNKINPRGRLWQDVLESTWQPINMKN
ncbi:ATP-dependent 6-phosphofructokinase [Entomospira culicis]|uniref:ATP-dependent 6-phosphofructokinase n=1 Tax=Entomospira culicis TaxID=2719989 RepID=A0A968GJR4_9SPIO|nr:ATP-dependent 6-phosphofructokinase [Entomospira culicis]NIZ19746.1 ATP-dependent 6-phosphofructokinase [Entomospira culicis]NIZ69960.1 ATP-dependent 6-phosphofructokinase [Entomospira culicis]WDI37065.1 ATP-dependent 6-phosphofructokinase [Entomospira culicis]WDI38694.1 ATP-dependent 6-phosphofructokinase [Entomospira culicis]